MIAKKIKQLRKTHNLTQSELASELGVTQQAIAKWEAGRSLPELSAISRIASFFGVTTDYLFNISDSTDLIKQFSNVRIIGEVKAGYDGFAYEEDLGSAPAAVSEGEDYRYLIVKGDSMAPYIQEGDMALVRIQPELQNGDIGVVIYADGEATLKKVYFKNGEVMLVPFNEAYETLTLRGSELDQLIIFGKVIETVTKW